MGVAESISAVRERIKAAAQRAGRNPAEVRLVVVTKGVPAGPVREAVTAGAAILGESRVQEAFSKMEEVNGDVAWHLIGTLQRNKVRRAVRAFELIHSVDRLELAEAIQRRAEELGVTQSILIQVNVAREAMKSGADPGPVRDLVRAAGGMTRLDIRGLMTIPPLPENPEDSRPHYRRLRELREALRAEAGMALPELSMGMSRDFECAIEEGATLVRIGTIIFT